MPGSQTAPGRAVLALGSRRSVSPSEAATSSAPGIVWLSRLNGWPMRSPADASPAPSRAQAHGLGPMWVTTPSSHRTCTTYSSPISRRTSKSNQIRASSSKIWPNLAKENPWISFAGLSLIKALRRPLGPFFFCAPIRP